MPLEQTVVSLGPQGRILIPSTLRQSLQLAEGERFLLTVDEDANIHLNPLRERIAAAEGLFKEFAPMAGSVADELIVQRRLEATKESSQE